MPATLPADHPHTINAKAQYAALSAMYKAKKQDDVDLYDTERQTDATIFVFIIVAIVIFVLAVRHWS